MHFLNFFQVLSDEEGKSSPQADTPVRSLLTVENSEGLAPLGPLDPARVWVQDDPIKSPWTELPECQVLGSVPQCCLPPPMTIAFLFSARGSLCVYDNRGMLYCISPGPLPWQPAVAARCKNNPPSLIDFT